MLDSISSKCLKNHVKPKQYETQEIMFSSHQTSLLKSCLPFIPRHGFTNACLLQGCKSLGLSSSAVGILSGPLDLAVYFYQSCNHELSNHLKQESDLRVTAKIRFAILKRLDLIDPVITNYHQAQNLLIQNPSVSLPLLLELVDEIWAQCGDKSLDFNWYSKRLILSGIYTTTEMFYINDVSENRLKTREFLDQRLNDSFEFSKMVSNVGNLSRLYASTIRFSGYKRN